MRTITLITTLFFMACTPSDTPTEPAPISALQVEGDVQLQSLGILNGGGAVEEQRFSLDTFTVVEAPDGDVELRMSNYDDEDRATLFAIGRNVFRQMDGEFATLDAAAEAWRSAADGQNELDLIDQLTPGTAFMIDVLGGQDYVAMVVDRSLELEGRCAERAMISLDLAPVDGF